VVEEVHTAVHNKPPVRLQEYGVDIFTICPTKSAFKKKLKKKLILVNGAVASSATWINGGEVIELLAEPETDAPRLDLKLKILYEDDYLAAVFKPAGLAVSGNKRRTLTNALTINLKQSALNDRCKPQPVHRLDYPTTGIVLVGKTTEAIRNLAALFKAREVKKTYLAASIGEMKDLKGSFTTAVENKEAFTEYQVLAKAESKRFNTLNLVELRPKTGRRHQLRKHLAENGNAILGDQVYSPKQLLLKGKGLYLHAHKLGFIHPFTHDLCCITADVPVKFQKIFPDFNFE